MNIIVTVRTRDEENNISRFCKTYQWADKILVADGGSEDKTVKKALEYKNVEVRNFKYKVFGKQKLWRNPHGKHMNFLWNWAIEEGADWIIFDDCDCVPTRILQTNARLIMENCPEGAIFAFRMYIYGKDRYFPKMNDPGQSIWAWMPSKHNIYASEENPWKHCVRGIPEVGLKLDKPNCLLHYFCPNESTIDRKLEFYKQSGQRPNALHPLDYCGNLRELPDWADWK